MLDRLKLPHVVGGALLLLAPLFAVGWLTRGDPADVPVLDIVGGGFVFNYRISDVHYGFTAVLRRPVESGSIIEARFEDPAGGDRLVVRERVDARSTSYALRSPPVRGVEAGRDYEVSVQLLDRAGSGLLFATTRRYRSDISDDVVPDVPLTVGPGYQRPDAVLPRGGG